MKDLDGTEFIVVRHGETVGNVQGRLQGQQDSELTELGLRQAQALAESFDGERIDALYSSDLWRAARTAEHIADRIGLPVQKDERLREWSFGIFEGLTLEEAERRYPDDYARYRAVGRDRTDFVLPKGESFGQMHARTVSFFEEMARRHPGQRIVAVTHGGPLGCIFRHVVGLGLEAPRRFKRYNASRNVVRFEGGEWALVSWGDLNHLKGIS